MRSVRGNSRKGSLELSIGMIVTLIIALAILSMGTILLKKIFFASTQQVSELDENTQHQIFDLLDEGGRIANPFNRQDTARGKPAIFGFGVRNTLDEAVPYTDTGDKGGNRFRIIITPALAPEGISVDAVKGWILVTNTATWVVEKDKPAPQGQIDAYVGNNDRRVFNIGIGIPRNASLGSYVFNVDVSYAGATNPTAYKPYAPTEKLYVSVK